MRRIATIAAVMTLPLVQIGMAAPAAAQPQAQVSTAQTSRDAGGAGRAYGLDRDNPDRAGVIIISLAALTTFIFGFIAAVKKSNPGTPASP